MDDLTQSNYGLSAPPETDATAELDNSLPRAVLRQGTHVLLDGTWRFALDPDDEGLMQEWQEGHDYHYTARGKELSSSAVASVSGGADRP